MANRMELALFVLGMACGGAGCASMLGYDDVSFDPNAGTAVDADGGPLASNGDAAPSANGDSGAIGNVGVDGGGDVTLPGCTPSCAQKTCGASDGCGGKCTACPASGLVCDQATWTCKNPSCTPSCANKKCGDSDGCGGVCTTCGQGLTCNTFAKQCVASCTPSCTGKMCGDSDGCGGKCSACPSGQNCNPQTLTCQTPCAPNCSGKACGESDGCGGKCTACPAPGQGCDTTTGQCASCSLSCGANGTCVFGWENGQHCQCAPGYYATYAGCQPVTGSPCDGVTCSGHGTCFAGPPLNAPECRCEGDYVSYGLACAPMNKIRCVDRDGTLKDKGTIRCSADDASYEVCRDGNGDGIVEWVTSGTPSCAAGSTCSACQSSKCDNGDGTGGQACPTGTVCMGKVHEVDVYVCVGGCDCTNCGTCDPGQFSGYQRACGSSQDSFANPTVACKSPCPHANEGCLPYGQFAFCFGSEGCASAAPQ